MAGFIDDEAEPANLVFRGGHQEPPGIAGPAIAAADRDAFDEAGALSRDDGGRDDPIGRTVDAELPRILRVRLTRLKDDPVDLLIGIRHGVP